MTCIIVFEGRFSKATVAGSMRSIRADFPPHGRLHLQQSSLLVEQLLEQVLLACIKGLL